MAMESTVHVVQAFIKGHRKSGVISIKLALMTRCKLLQRRIEYQILMLNNNWDEPKRAPHLHVSENFY